MTKKFNESITNSLRDLLAEALHTQTSPSSEEINALIDKTQTYQNTLPTESIKNLISVDIINFLTNIKSWSKTKWQEIVLTDLISYWKSNAKVANFALFANPFFESIGKTLSKSVRKAKPISPSTLTFEEYLQKTKKSPSSSSIASTSSSLPNTPKTTPTHDDMDDGWEAAAPSSLRVKSTPAPAPLTTNRFTRLIDQPSSTPAKTAPQPLQTKPAASPQKISYADALKKISSPLNTGTTAGSDRISRRPDTTTSLRTGYSRHPR